MFIQAIIKEIAVTKEAIDLAFEVSSDIFDPVSSVPKVEAVFQCEKDERRIPLNVNNYTKNKETNTWSVFGVGIFALKNLFWDCTWKKLHVFLEVEYENQTYHQIPITSDTGDKLAYGTLSLQDTSIEITLKKEIDALLTHNPGTIRIILAILLHACAGVIGLFIVPWFMIDALAILLLHTEKKNKKIEGGFLKQFVLYVGWRYFGFCRNGKGITGLKTNVTRMYYQLLNSLHRNKRNILFLSNRRDDMTGNFEYVYDKLKAYPELKNTFWLDSSEIKTIKLVKLCKLASMMAKAKVILIDDYMPLLDDITLSRKTSVIQLWHACGAFKTFGFSRMGKTGGPGEGTVAHRYYDYAIVSSENIANYYAEGFGIAEKKVLPLGVPRTDIFFDQQYSVNVRNKLYQEYPALKEKKVILFAPTFRGNGKLSAFYEAKRFNPNQLIERLSDEYILIIKHHPFVSMKYEIQDKYKERIFDFSKESEINDLLFITDLLITDYSSVVFEASLLKIPMLFYAYDLMDYIATRDFYSQYDSFVPGKIVKTQKDLIQTIVDKDYDNQRVEEFSRYYFEQQDGNSAVRIAEFIKELM